MLLTERLALFDAIFCQTLIDKKDKQLQMRDSDIFSYQSIIAGYAHIPLHFPP